jgi:hypothetical protein
VCMQSFPEKGLAVSSRICYNSKLTYHDAPRLILADIPMFQLDFINVIKYALSAVFIPKAHKTALLINYNQVLLNGKKQNQFS